ncbi:electron transfer flavoprotein subunit alpha/FixB family protein [Devosia sp.]|uniref:electron transfer flavoprotein subunit alpha/FixB family protein n=1 Tax=Devosia sp. TaxID=1871048 RepID=UPI002F1D3FFF
MATLVLVEHDNTELNPMTNRAVAAAAALGQPVDCLVSGVDCRIVAEQASRLHGVRTVLLASAEGLRHGPAEAVARVVMTVAEKYDAIVAPASTGGKDSLPRVAALLDVTHVSNVTKIIDPWTFEHPIVAGNAIEVVRTTQAIRILTVRTSAFEPVQGGGDATIVEITPDLAGVKGVVVSANTVVSDRPELSGARVVVSGGRALASRENFERLLHPLADALGAALGASRAAVDAGFAPGDWQVGQTGKIVAPEVYIAIGISGAVQHLAGMKDAKLIIAINKDADAPIFDAADYGLVGDLFEIVPQLVSELALP